MPETQHAFITGRYLMGLPRTPPSQHNGQVRSQLRRWRACCCRAFTFGSCVMLEVPGSVFFRGGRVSDFLDRSSLGPQELCNSEATEKPKHEWLRNWAHVTLRPPSLRGSRGAPRSRPGPQTVTVIAAVRLIKHLPHSKLILGFSDLEFDHSRATPLKSLAVRLGALGRKMGPRSRSRTTRREEPVYVLQWARLCHCCLYGDNYDDFVRPASHDRETVILVRGGTPPVYDVFQLRRTGSLRTCSC